MPSAGVQPIPSIPQILSGVAEMRKTVSKDTWTQAVAKFMGKLSAAEQHYSGQRSRELLRTAAGRALATDLGWVGQDCSKLARAAAGISSADAPTFVDALKAGLNITNVPSAPPPAQRAARIGKPSAGPLVAALNAFGAPGNGVAVVLPPPVLGQAPAPQARAFQQNYDYGSVRKLVDAVLATPALVEELRAAADVSLKDESVALVSTQGFEERVERLLAKSPRLSDATQRGFVSEALLNNLLTPEDPRLKFEARSLSDVATAFLRARSILKPSAALDTVAVKCRPVPVTFGGKTYKWDLPAIADALKDADQASSTVSLLRRMRDAYSASAGLSAGQKEAVRSELVELGFLKRRS